MTRAPVGDAEACGMSDAPSHDCYSVGSSVRLIELMHHRWSVGTS